MNTEDKEFKYIKNGPCDHEDYDEYARVLSEKINDDDVYNIGIISPYGGGKSSLLLRYKNHYSGKLKNNIKTVSLANFIENDDEYDETAIEKSILEQLLYEAKHSTLPNSSIKRIHSRIGYLIASIVLVVALIACATFDYLFWKGMVLDNLDKNATLAVRIISIALPLLILAALIITVVMSARLIRIKYKEIELDFGKDEGKTQSILNRFIDELIYYFKQTNTRVVIFEDIDRFKGFKIFSKLRELNTILNDNAELKKNKITFVYAINDGLFKDAEGRSKFFDYIISLLPIMNADNSRDFMYLGIEGSICGKDLGLDEVFISDISKYITDIRVLKNTLNDCLLYKQVLGLKDKSDLEKLFALMVYKNLMPEDFNSLQKEEGILYSLLNGEKEKAISEYIDNVSSKFKEIDEQIDSLRNDSSILSDFKELKNYIAGILFQYGSEYPNQNTGYVDLSSLDTFEGVTNGICIRKSINENYYGPRPHTFGMSIQELNNRLGIGIVELESKITGKNNEAIASLKSKKIKMEETISSLRAMPIRDLIKNGIYTPAITRYNEDDEKSKNNAKNRMMLIDMLSKGYIDYSYKRMLTKSNNDILSIEDKNILYCITSNQTIDPNATIDNPKMLINDLKDYMFLDEKIFNYSLIDYLFNNVGNETKKQNFIATISRRSDASKKFLANYCSKGYSIKNILSISKNTYEDIICDIMSNSDDDKVKDIVIGELLSLENIELIEAFNKDNVISIWLGNSKSLIETFTKTASTNFVCDVLKTLNVVVKEIDYYQEYTEDEKKLFGFIVDNGLYAVSKNNINKITRFYLGSPQVNISCFYLTDKAVKEIFLNHINEFVGLIIELSESLDETTETINFVLKNESINDANKKCFIQKLNKTVDYSSDYSKEVQDELINDNKLVPNWNTIQLLFKEDSNLLLIKKHLEGNISYYENTKCANEETLTQITNEINFDKKETFIRIIKAFDCKLIPVSVLDDAKCALLIEVGLIDSDVQNLLECLNRPTVIEAMIIKNPDLISNIGKQTTSKELILFLLKSNKIDDSQKHLIIIATQSSISISDGETANLILGIIADKDNSELGAATLISIYNMVSSVKEKDAVKEIGYKYLTDTELLAFVREADSEIMQWLSLSSSHKIEKTIFDNSSLYQSLLRSNLLVIKRTSKINYSIDSSKIAN